MCGIIGYVGNNRAVDVLLSGLKKLEYRGYDSAGIATISDGKIKTKKDIGKIEEVNQKVNFSELSGNIGLAHTRWATCGKVTKENAHPHLDCTGKISIIHNGIIENYGQLKEDLIKKGHNFSSNTDTEVIAHLIEDEYKGDLKEAVISAIKHLEGSFALGVIHADKEELVAARYESPLIIGVGSGENFIASDVPAIMEYTKNIIYLGNKEVAVLRGDSVSLFDAEGNPVEGKKIGRAHV